jgi:acetylglutamate kinase
MHGQLLNTNADTIASEIAIALSEMYMVIQIIASKTRRFTRFRRITSVLNYGSEIRQIEIRKETIHSGMILN